MASPPRPSPSPFHPGEERVQERMGVREAIAPWAKKVVRPYLPEEHRSFFASLSYLVLAARDSGGRPWITLLWGEPGFAVSADPGSLDVAALPTAGDALEERLVPGADVGLLGIELSTRRRNRLNGKVERSGAGHFRLGVVQSFGNCPQYITERSEQRAASSASAGSAERATQLGERERELIARADTFFIATGFRGEGEDAAFGMDASHRGGEPGFVRVEDERRLVFPDYAGNNHFNTLGNLVLDSRAGLLFVDFESGDLLQLTGRAEIDWQGSESSGPERRVTLHIEELCWRTAALPLRFESSGVSLRELRLVEKRRETEDVVSFYFASRDGGSLSPFHAGQHLPIRIPIQATVGDGAAPKVEWIERSYSLSCAPRAERYRLTTKRLEGGLVSSWMHDRFSEGDILLAGTPRGDFCLRPPSHGPVFLIGAGVGITPLVSMLHELAEARSGRQVRFIYATKDAAHQPLRSELEGLLAKLPDGHLHSAYSRPGPSDLRAPGDPHDGRVDRDFLSQWLSQPDPTAAFYLCGPRNFMAQVSEALESLGVSSEAIHSESFGSAERS